MVTLEIGTGTVVVAIAVVGFAAYGLYRAGKRSMASQKQQPQQPESRIKASPNMVNAQRAFLSNIPKMMPFFKGVEEITIDKEGLTDTIIDVNDDDLIGLWKLLKNRPEYFIDIISSWGVSPERCMELVATNNTKNQYNTYDGSVIEPGVRYRVTDACWFQTISNAEGKSEKLVVKKGLITKKS